MEGPVRKNAEGRISKCSEGRSSRIGGICEQYSLKSELSADRTVEKYKSNISKNLETIFRLPSNNRMLLDKSPSVSMRRIYRDGSNASILVKPLESAALKLQCVQSRSFRASFLWTADSEKGDSPKSTRRVLIRRTVQTFQWTSREVAAKVYTILNLTPAFVFFHPLRSSDSKVQRQPTAC